MIIWWHRWARVLVGGGSRVAGTGRRTLAWARWLLVGRIMIMLIKLIMIHDHNFREKCTGWKRARALSERYGYTKVIITIAIIVVIRIIIATWPNLQRTISFKLKWFEMMSNVDFSPSGKCSMWRTPSDRRWHFADKESHIYIHQTLPLKKSINFFSLPCKYICFEGKLFIWLIVWKCVSDVLDLLMLVTSQSK